MAALNDEFDGGRGGHVRTGKVCSSDAGCPSDTVTADRLWEALHQARAGRTPQTLAHTQDAVFRFYLPMARTLARAAVGEPAHQVVAERAAELGLADAVLALAASCQQWIPQVRRVGDRTATSQPVLGQGPGHSVRVHRRLTPPLAEWAGSGRAGRPEM
jgi:hypothetical protein